MSNYAIVGGELCHYGVKGMKWGRRRFQNKDGSLTAKGIKRYAQKGYAEDSYNRNKSVVGKAWDRYTGAHKIEGEMMYNMSSKKQNKARAEKYLKEHPIQDKKISKLRVSKKQMNRVNSILASDRVQQEVDRINKRGRAPTTNEIIDRLNKFGNVPTTKDQLERSRRNNI